MMARTRDKLTPLAAALGLMLPNLAFGAAPAAADPSGTWLTQDGRARIRIEKCGPNREQACGYVVWLKASPEGGPPGTDLKNPDPGKTARGLLGHQLILGLKPNGQGRYEGQIYNAEDGKSYDVTIWSDTPAALNVKGCLVAFLCSTQTWARTTDVLPGQLAGPTGGPGGPRPDPEWAAKPSAGSGNPAQAAAPKRDPKQRP